MIKLFDLSSGILVPTEHCYSLKALREIMDEYPDECVKIYSYLFYMTCNNPDLNPFFDAPEKDREELILHQLDADFSTEDDLVVAGLELCRKLYETPTQRAYMGIKNMLDKLSTYMDTSAITAGRDGNINSLVNAAVKFDQIRLSFKGIYKDLMEEQSSSARGGADIAYDQR